MRGTPINITRNKRPDLRKNGMKALDGAGDTPDDRETRMMT